MCVKQTPDVLAWLERYGNPEWNDYFDRRGNCISMKNNLGYWPEPIDVKEVVKVPDDFFNDEIPF